VCVCVYFVGLVSWINKRLFIPGMTNLQHVERGGLSGKYNYALPQTTAHTVTVITNVVWYLKCTAYMTMLFFLNKLTSIKFRNNINHDLKM
jgi:hypothetical protein